jgi:hypothetical protein
MKQRFTGRCMEITQCPTHYLTNCMVYVWGLLNHTGDQNEKVESRKNKDFKRVQ